METCWKITETGYVYQRNNDLAEEDARAISYELENLFVDNKVDKIGLDYIVYHQMAAGFTANEREVLHLPAIYPYLMSISHKGNLSQSRFHYRISYFNNNHKEFINPRIIGSYIQLSPEVEYMFNSAQYEIVSTIKICNEKVKNLTGIAPLVFSCENLAKIKKVMSGVEVTLDKYLKAQNIAVPDKLSINIEKESDGTYRVKPILLEEKDESFAPITNAASFTSAFSRQKDVNITYVGEDQTIYVIKPNVKKGLQEIKRKDRFNKEEAERIIKQPKETFTADAFEFDLDNYSDRVVSIGEFIRKNLPYIKLSEGSWLPEEGTALGGTTSTESLPVIDQENVLEIMEKIKKAREEEKEEIQYDGKTYPVTAELAQLAYQVFKKYFGEDDSTRQPTKNIVHDRSFKALNIKDNVDSLEYESRKKISAVLDEKMFAGLKPEINLYEHQQRGVQWMFSCWKEGHRGVLLADDMGLGKTMQAYTFISGFKLSSPAQDIKSVLVVAPVSLLKNWEDEFNKFIRPNLFAAIIRLYGGAIRSYRINEQVNLEPLARNQLVLTTYETLRDYQLSFGCIEWSVMVIDEAQKIKNPTTMVTTAVKAMKYDFGIALTGTPVENTWNDLWSIMDFVAPGKLGSLKEFNKQYQGKLKQVKENKKELELSS